MRKILFVGLLVFAFLFTLSDRALAAKPKAVQLMVSVVGASGNWDVEGYKAFKAMGDKYGFEISVAERVSYAKASQFLRDYASRGYKLIIAHSAGYARAVLEVAPEFPNSWFIIFSDLKSTGGQKNVAGWAFNFSEYGYLEGVLAGLMTKTNRIGWVTAVPIPAHTRLLGGFFEGLRTVNKKAKVDIIWTQTWSDPAKGKEAALHLVEKGADVLFHASNITGWGIFEAAKEKNVMAVGYMTDESKLAPDRVITSGILDFRRGYDEIGRMFTQGTLEAKIYPANIANGNIYFAPFHKSVPASVAAKVKKLIANVRSGELKIRTVYYKPKKR